MNKGNVYIWYSNATDVTGKALAEALGVEGGTEPPSDNKQMVIGWGCKEKNFTPSQGVRYINRPSNIYSNRNKYNALTKLEDKVNVFNFSENYQDFDSGEYPLIGRKKYHQGGKDFWLCMNIEQAKKAKREGASYFQVYGNNKDEYRIHVIRDEVPIIAKKVVQDDPQTSFVAQQKDKIKEYAAKHNIELCDNTLGLVLKRLSREHKHADPIIRSNTRGWKFANVDNAPQSLIQQAKKAVDALGLDFGAVDCCADFIDAPWILEVNTGPGLQGAALAAYRDRFDNMIIEEINLRNRQTSSKPAFRPVFMEPEENNRAINTTSKKASLKHKMAMLNELIDAADEKEAQALESLAFKIFKRG